MSIDVPEPEQSGSLHRLLQKIRLHLRKRNGSLKESLQEVIEEHEGEALGHEEKALIDNVLSFSDLKVEDAMIPRSDIVWLNDDIGLEELKEKIIKEGHTRMPVCASSLDDPLGFLHVKDLFPIFFGQVPFDVRAILRKILFVPPSMPVADLLIKMRHTRVHIAIVVDEYGGTCGLVTMENVVEQIFGEIEDEHDTSDATQVLAIADNIFEVSARVPVEELEKILKLKLLKEDEDFDTLGGLIMVLLDRVPVTGEVVTHPSGVEFEVLDADARRVKRVRVRKVPAAVSSFEEPKKKSSFEDAKKSSLEEPKKRSKVG